MAQGDFGLQDQIHLLGLDDGQTSKSSLALSSQQPYYSNKDITILHYIVSTAQEQLDSSPNPKPLPAAVLFKAYDDVLPTFGINPDNDHHLSAMVFRIGGESGNGSLLDKFHALLRRMGILLEFDDNVTISDLSSYVPSTSGHEATEIPALETSAPVVVDQEKEDARPELKQSGAVTNHVDRAHGPYGGDKPPNLHDSKRTQAVPHSAQALKQQHKGVSFGAISIRPGRELEKTSDVSEKKPTAESNDAHRRLQKSVMISAIDRWRKVASEKTITRAARDHGLMGVGGERRPQNPPKKVSTAKDPRASESNSPQAHAATEAAAYDLDSAENDALLLRAVRARQIFLASRILSRWADETAIRADREAIARRHMVRFRCFNSWVQAPYSKLPRVRHLKALSALQKLRNAVARHKGQLEMTASLTVTSQMGKIAFHVLNLWLSRVLSQVYATTMVRLVQMATFNRWLAQSLECSETRGNIAWLSRCNRCRREFAIWRNHQARHSSQARSSQQLAVAFGRLQLLRTWKNHIEVGRRAYSCRQVLAMDQSAHRLDIWRLRARAQAFREKREHTSAMALIGAWVSSVSRHSALQVSSVNYCGFKAAMKLTSHISRFTQTQQQLDVLGYRAQWYIRATFLLESFGAVARHRKQQMKLVVRRYLMMRYTQASSKRRRRGFYTALHQWQSHVAASEAMTSAADQYESRHNANRKRTLCVSWSRRAAEEAVSHAATLHLRRDEFLDDWGTRALANHQQEVDAAALWATEQQRQFLKTWKRSTLQIGGQAHSAATVRRRHEHDHRNRAFHRWRQMAGRSKNGDIFPDLQSPAPRRQSTKPPRTSLKQSKWLPLFRRLDYKQDASTPIRTPSRSTGLPFPATHGPALRFMDPVVEADGKLGRSVGRGSDLWEMGLAGRQFRPRQGDMATTTTPKVPVPNRVQISSRFV